MITGIGIGTEMALNGAAAHAFTHIIYKALLLMSAGSVLYATGKRKCTELGGLFRTMPLTMVCGTIGALSISSFPLTSGFISKSLISQAAADGQMLIVWLFLTAASAGVFLHAGIKFPWFVFFQKDSGLRPPEPPKNQSYYDDEKCQKKHIRNLAPTMIVWDSLGIHVGAIWGPKHLQKPNWELLTSYFHNFLLFPLMGPSLSSGSTWKNLLNFRNGPKCPDPQRTQNPPPPPCHGNENGRER